MHRSLTLLPVCAALLLAACGEDEPQEEAAVQSEAAAEVAAEPASPPNPTPAPEPEPEVAVAEPVDLTPPAPTAVEVVENMAQDAVNEVAQTAAEGLNSLAGGQSLEEVADQAVNSVTEGLTGLLADSPASDAVGGLAAITSQLTEGAASVADDTMETVGDAAGSAAEATQEVAADTMAVASDAAEAAQTAAEDVVADAAAVVEEAMPEAPSEMPAVDWQSVFSAEVPFYNLSEAPVTAYTEPMGAEVAGTVEAGQGGFIETCNATADWCLIPFGEGDQTGWVDMSAFGGVAN